MMGKEDYKPLTKEDMFTAIYPIDVLSAREGLKKELSEIFDYEMTLLNKIIDKWFDIGAGEKKKWLKTYLEQ